MALLPPPNLKLKPPPAATPSKDAAPAWAGTAAASKRGAVTELRDLLRTMESLPSNPSVAMRVLWVADDPRASASELANTLELDPALTAKVLRIANSAYYSPAARATNVPRAVVTIGFATVQALAAAAVTGLDDAAQLPDGFWAHSAQVAHATGLVARHFGVGSNDAFAAGLLHDLGEGVMCRIAPEVWAEVEESTETGTVERLEVERERFGVTHPEVVDRILRAWHLPETLCSAVGTHHGAQSQTPLACALRAGMALAKLVCDDLDDAEEEALRSQLNDAEITDEFIEKVSGRLATETAALAESFQ